MRRSTRSSDSVLLGLRSETAPFGNETGVTECCRATHRASCVDRSWFPKKVGVARRGARGQSLHQDRRPSESPGGNPSLGRLMYPSGDSPLWHEFPRDRSNWGSALALKGRIWVTDVRLTTSSAAAAPALRRPAPRRPTEPRRDSARPTRSLGSWVPVPLQGCR